ncbi:MAG TPA: hypothetical protein VFC10_03390 [Terriglobia bacterium]|nr:hypothetical protein [Terriglobia bacterium]
MRRALFFCVLLLAFYTVLGRAHAEQENAPIKATLCELAEQPEKYAGKMVAVHASEMGKGFWIEDFTNKACSSWAQVIVVYPDQVKPAPGFDLLRDDAFNKFFEEVRKGKNVEATYEGRFDVAYVWRNHKRIDVGSDKGYGKKHRYGARIVLRRISDVVSRPRYSK